MKVVALRCDAGRCHHEFTGRDEPVERTRRAAFCQGWRYGAGVPTDLGPRGGRDYCPDHAHLATDDLALQETSR